MYHRCIQTSVLLWLTLLTDAKRWYSAALAENASSKSTRFEPPKFQLRSNYVENNEHNYLPLALLNKSNDINDQWNFLKFEITTSSPTVTAYSKKISKIKLNHKGAAGNTPAGYKGTPNRDAEIITGKIRYRDAIQIKNVTPVFKFDKTIHNINVIRKTKPKRKIVRRCPTVTHRNNKQLGLNKTAEGRFLEVFEVVEFKHVVCTSSSGLEGTCLPDSECITSGGTTMGSCADGYGVCCITQFTCDDTSSASFGWFINPGFPLPSTDRLSCVFTLNKASRDIKQIRLDFWNFELLAPSFGTCEQDQFVVSGQNVNNVIPILCGVNSGQHIYIEVGDVEGPITFSVQTVSADSRLFSIKITQLTSFDDLAAPPGCLQYFKGTQGYLESFNFRDRSAISISRTRSYLNNLNYAMCIERAPEICSVTYANTGSMQIVNYDTDGLPVIPPEQAGVEIFNCPTDWLLIAATRLCGERLNDGSVLQDFALDAPVTDIAAGPMVVWFRSDGGFVGKGFRIQYQQNNC